MDRVVLSLEADRNVAWIEDIPILGEAIPTSSDINLGVHLGRDYPGTRLLTLNKNDLSSNGIGFRYSGSATISAHIAAGRLPGVPAGYEETDTVDMTVIGIIGPSPSSWAPFPDERGEKLTLQYDIWLALPGSVNQVWFAGTLDILPGVLG